MPEERAYALTITGLSLEQAKTLYAAHIGCAYGDLIPGDEIPGLPTSYTGRARAFWTTHSDVLVDMRPVSELGVLAEHITRRASLER